MNLLEQHVLTTTSGPICHCRLDVGTESCHLRYKILSYVCSGQQKVCFYSSFQHKKKSLRLLAKIRTDYRWRRKLFEILSFPGQNKSRISHLESRISHQASRITHHASRITHHASRITHHASRITHHASRITHLASRISHLCISHLASRIYYLLSLSVISNL